MDCAPEESDVARTLGDLGAFVNVCEHNSVPCFYSCEIIPIASIHPLKPLYFNVSVVRRNKLAIESKCHNLDKSPIFHIGAVNILEAIRILVSCHTLTDAQFSFAYYRWLDTVPPMSEDLFSEVFTLLRSSPSLSCFQFIISPTLHNATLHCKHFQSLVCENPRLETLTVSASGSGFVVLVEAIAVCLSRNTVLKSFTLRISTYKYGMNQESLEILFRPFTSSSPSEANVHLKELALYLQNPDAYWVDAIANLVCRNTTLKKLDLRFRKLSSGLKHSWRELRALASALQSNTTLKHVQCIYGWDHYVNYPPDDVKYITDKNFWQEVFQIQEILRTMIDNELRMNTSLESFAVEHWTLLRVGTEWQMSYRGPCLREQTNEDFKLGYNCKQRVQFGARMEHH
ncbi:hypothetical protein KC19_6G199600 [Ceratodon purpureus]|uniref:Uncharacterized protein n=1 Tax=Ceratodon purpureus TaxID=3225 RepID=A0A8T0HJJ0_CERPU|nr:hypothetical protein KC19_6G199600 [Ceratodon purpureus]